MSAMSRRRPGSSCRPCRKARLGCDAILRKDSPCTNCVRRGKDCSNVNGVHEAVGASKQPSASLAGNESDRQTTRIFSVTTEEVANSPLTAISSTGNKLCRRTQAATLHDMLWDIFMSIFESRFTLMLGPSCCPHLETTLGIKASVSRTVLYLDKVADDFLVPPSPHALGLGGGLDLSSRKAKIDHGLNSALRYAIYAYSARWVPLRASFPPQSIHENPRKDARELQTRLWHKAKLHILQAMSYPSYRSILALLLFTLTEMPLDNDDPGINALCSRILLSYFGRLQSLTAYIANQPLSSSTRVSPYIHHAIQTKPRQDPSGVEQRIQHMRDSMLWIGILCDSSRSVIHRVPSVILPGNSGDTKAWDFIRQRTLIFDRSFRVLHTSPLPLSDEVVVVLLQHASACKTMYLGVISQFRDSLSLCNADHTSELARKVSEERRRYHDAFDQLLAKCARDYLTMAFGSQLNYFLLIAHQALGSLILAEILETLDSLPPSMDEPATIRLQACGAVVHVLSLVLSYDRHSAEDLPYGSRLLHDSLPELMVEVLSETGKAIFSLAAKSTISEPTKQVMLSVVSSALMVMSQISLSASFALASLQGLSSPRQLCAPTGVDSMQHRAPPRPATAFLMCEDELVQGFLKEMDNPEGLGSATLDDIIREHDKSVFENCDPSAIAHPTVSEGSAFSHQLSPASWNSTD